VRSMKKLLFVSMLAAGVVGLACAGGCAKDGNAPIRLSYSVFFPPTHVHAQLAASWAAEVEKRSGGRLKISVYPGATLTKADQCWAGVVDGISDLGMSCLAYTPGPFPLLEALDLPLKWPDGEVATAVSAELAEKYAAESALPAKLLYLHAHGPGVLATRQKVENLEDLQRLKIRGTGLSAQIVEALGGTAIGMSQPDTYDALQKGVVDGTFCPIETLKGWRQGECVKYVLEVPEVGYTTAMFVAMNRKKWDSLPPDLQQILLDTSAEWLPKHGKAWCDADDEGRAFAAEKGVEFLRLPPDEAARWAEKVAPLLDAYVARCEAKGLPGRAFLTDAQEAIKASGK